MGLNVYLTDDTVKMEPLRCVIFIREDGETKEITLGEWNANYPEKGPN